MNWFAAGWTGGLIVSPKASCLFAWHEGRQEWWRHHFKISIRQLNIGQKKSAGVSLEEMDRSCSSDVGFSGGPLFHSKECRRKVEEADELAQKTTDPAVRTAYEEIARRWREMAERAERNKW
jgi:hypothetical protein